MQDIEEIKELQNTFQKCADILGETIKLSEELDKEQDEKKIKRINKKIEEKVGLFMVQMLKINNLK